MAVSINPIHPISSILRPFLTLSVSPSYQNFAHSYSRPSRAMAMTSDTTQSQNRMFQLKVDPLTGNSEWVVIVEGENGGVFEDSSPDSSPLGRTLYLDMLNDTRRNRAYQAAIEKAISNSKPYHVLDIGAGTGLLSMMAARSMGLGAQTAPCHTQKGQVTACESFLPMVKLMHKVLRLNGLQGLVRVINKRSDELRVGVGVDSRADFLVSEILDSELLGEGMIPTLQNAFDTLLVDNPQVVPYRATIYGQLVESPFLWRLHDLYSNETSTSDGIHLVPKGLQKILQVQPKQYPMHCDPLKEEIKLLSEPFRIFEIDFWKRPESCGEVQLQIKATEDGIVNAIVSWWVLQLDQEGTIFYSTAPKWIKDMQAEFNEGDENWCDHWKQCVWFVPGKGVSVTVDEELHIDAVHTDVSVSYGLKAVNFRDEFKHLRHHHQDVQLYLSPERMAIYGDSDWRSCMVSAIQKSLQGKDSPLCCVADDSLFLPILITHISRSSSVTSLFPGLREKGCLYLQAVAQANGFTEDRIKVLGLENFLAIHSTGQMKVDLVVGEPFYYGNEGQLPWQNLRFWKQRTLLDKILSREVQILPCKGILKACAVFLPDFWSSRRGLEKIEGFDHSTVNVVLGSCSGLPPSQESPCLPFFVWQCGEMKELSERFDVMEFDFSKPMHSVSGKRKIGFTQSGICHGFVLWIDWVMDPESSVVISCGPDHRYWKQGVKLVSKPLVVKTCADGDSVGATLVEIEACFDCDNGNLNIKHAFR